MRNHVTKIFLAGDISTYNIPDFNTENICPEFRRRVTQADLAIFNLEGPIALSKQAVDENEIEFRENKIQNMVYKLLARINSYVFSKKEFRVYSDKRIFDLLKLNKTTLVTLANNHIKDLGKQGFIQTISALSERGIRFIGAGENINKIFNFYEFLDIIFINVNLIAIKKMGLNLGLYSATKNSFGSDYIAFGELQSLIKKYKLNKKSVVLIIHGGRELAQNKQQLALDLEALKKLDANITVVHHPHRYVQTEHENHQIFILGDFIFKSIDNRLSLSRESAALEISSGDGNLVTKLIRFKANEVYRY